MKRAEITAALPLVFGLNRLEAAAAVGVSASTFDKMIAAGTMPRPRKATDKRLVWDVDELRIAFKGLPHLDEDADEADDTWADL